MCLIMVNGEWLLSPMLIVIHHGQLWCMFTVNHDGSWLTDWFMRGHIGQSYPAWMSTAGVNSLGYKRGK